MCIEIGARYPDNFRCEFIILGTQAPEVAVRLVSPEGKMSQWSGTR
jgi:hypothetical protein